MFLLGWARSPQFVLSSECKIEHCEACFSHNFCTKCKEGLYLHKGRCYPACPEGSSAANGTMECSSPGKSWQALWAEGPGPQEEGLGKGLAREWVGWGTVQGELTLPLFSGSPRTLLPSGLKIPAA